MERVISHDDFYELDEIVKQIREDEGKNDSAVDEPVRITTYSVESNYRCYNDDEFCGTFEECLDYIKNEYINSNNEDRRDSDYRIAYIYLDENGSETYCEEIWKKEEILELV